MRVTLFPGVLPRCQTSSLEGPEPQSLRKVVAPDPSMPGARFRGGETVGCTANAQTKRSLLNSALPEGKEKTMSPGDASSALTSYRPGCFELREVGKRPGKGRGGFLGTNHAGPTAPMAQKENPQTHSRTQEPRLIRFLQASQVPSRSGLSTTLVSSRDQPCPGPGGPRFTSGLSVLGGRAPTWHWLQNSTGPVEPGPGLNSRVRGQPNHFQRFLIQGTRSK